MKRNMKEWAQALIESPERRALPVMTYPGLALVNKGVLDVIRDGESQFTSIAALAERYPSAAVVTIMDLSVESEAFGCPIIFSETDVPTVAARIITDLDSADALKVPKVGAGRTSVYIRAVELAAEKITDRPTFGGHIGPFSLTGRLMDMTEAMVNMMIEPEMVHTILEKCTLFLIEYAKALKQAGANGIIIAEPAAGLLSPEQCQEFSSQYVKRIVDAVQDDSFMVVLHNCGNTTKLVSSLVSTGAMALHFGNAVDMANILPQVPEDRLALGNIDPESVFKAGTTDEMRTKTLILLEKMAPYRNFVLSSGCDVPPGTPTENVDAFYAALQEYNDRSR